MKQTPGGWTVIDEKAAVLTSTYEFSPNNTSNAFIARIADGKLLVVSPSVGLTDAQAAELESYGEVGAIVANNGFHHLGQTEWRKRYPNARAFAAPEAQKRIKAKNPEVGPFEPLSALQPLLGDNVGMREVANTKCGESWFWARTEGGTAWYVSDVLANMPKLPSALPIKFLFWATGSAPGLRVFGLAAKFILKDKKGTLQALLEDMEANPPTVVVPAHGDLVTQGNVAESVKAVVQAAA